MPPVVRLVQSGAEQNGKDSAHFRNGRRLIFQRLSRTSPKSLLGRALRLPLQFVPRHSVVTVKSGINKGMLWVAGSSVHSCWLGHYEPEKQALVRRLTRRGMTVFDIGANAGFYTLAFSRLVGETGRVLAFEPYAGNAVNLMRHLALNHIGNATLVQAAVAAHAGVSGFKTDFSDSEWHLSDLARDYMVPAISLDPLVASGVFPLPDIIKIDVEGAEARVLEGASDLLKHGKTSLLIALHGIEPLRQCLSLLGQLRYEAYRFDGQRLSPACGNVDEIYAMPIAGNA